MVPDGWEKTKIGNITAWASGGTPSKANAGYWSGTIPWISASTMKGHKFSRSNLHITKQGLKLGSKLARKNDLLLLVRGSMLWNKIPIGMVIHDLAFNQDVKCISVKQEKILPEFLLYWFLANENMLSHMVTGTGIGAGKLDTQELISLKINLPLLPEQQKIAQILSTWDNAIEKLEALIAAKQKRKKALMQQLLTGKKRFSGFVKSNDKLQTRFGSTPTDWEYISIGEAAKQISVKNNEGLNLQVLSCTKHYGLVDSLTYFGKQIFSQDTSTYKIVPRNSFAYATNHIEEGSIGYQNICDKALISPMYTVFQTENNINDSFLYRLLKTELYRHIFEVNTNASVDRRGSLRWNQFSQIKIPIPSLSEQKKIALVFSTADKEIETHQKQLEAFKQQKKGLMQQLLTGKKRVKLDNGKPHV